MRQLRTAAVLASAVAAGAVAAPAAPAEAAGGTTPPNCATTLSGPQATATIAAQPTPGKPGTVAVYAGAAASQSLPVSYTYDFGDGVVETVQDKIVEHTLPGPGSWTVTVTVKDSNGVTSTSPVCLVAPGSSPADAVHRLAGGDRYETGVAISQNVWTDVAGQDYLADPARRQAHAVVLASGANFPDALAGVPLATYKQGPLLLTTPDSLHPATEQEIRRILPTGSTVYILGGTAAISPAVEDQLHHDGYQTVRYGGSDRYGTAMQIATKGLDSPANVLVVTGTNFPDALAAGPVATSDNRTVDGKPAAILLSNGNSVTDAATAAYVKARMTWSPQADWMASHVLGIGGAAADALQRLATGSTAPTPSPLIVLGCTGFGVGQNGSLVWNYLAGHDRFETADCLVGDGVHTEHTAYTNDNPVWHFGFADATSFADALTGAAELATTSGSILLTDQDSLPPAVAATLKDDQSGGSVWTTVDIFGGTEAVSTTVENQVRAELQ